MVASSTRIVSARHSRSLLRAADFSSGISRGERGGLRVLGVRPVNQITEAIIGDAIRVHRELGPGLLESTYEECLAMLLLQRGFRVDRQKAVAAHFMGVELEGAFRLDLLVEESVIVEVKAITKLDPVHISQLNTYLKFSDCEVGLLINFNVSRLVDGLRRVVRGYEGTSSTSQSSANSARNPAVKPRAR